VDSKNGYEADEYKPFAALFSQMRPTPKKTIANCPKSAHRAPMSGQFNVRPVAQMRLAVRMTMRSRRETVHFRASVPTQGHRSRTRIGAYEIVTDEEMIEGLSFPCFRRVATMIMVPGRRRNILRWK